jgi:phosphohistidine phosphatase SixA
MQLKLFIVRHGQYGRDGSPDPPISPAGTKQATNAGLVVARYSEHVSTVFSSPLSRAVMTSTIISKMINSPYRILDCLEPEADPEPFITTLRTLGDSDIVAVGHLPNLRKLFSILCSPSEPVSFHLDAGGMACLRILSGSDEYRAILDWIITSDQAADIAIRYS